jgi:hypothetical protein
MTLLLAAGADLSPFWLVAAVASPGHIVADLAFEDEWRTADGFRRRGWASQWRR